VFVVQNRFTSALYMLAFFVHIAHACDSTVFSDGDNWRLAVHIFAKSYTAPSHPLYILYTIALYLRVYGIMHVNFLGVRLVHKVVFTSYISLPYCSLFPLFLEKLNGTQGSSFACVVLFLV